MSVATEPSTSSSIQLSQQCRRFELSDIMLATDNFDESLVIGKGGFGKVYIGTILNGSATVLAAIKRLDLNSNQGAPEFWAEVEMLSKLRHCNLVSLFGYCNDEEEMILVYEYMPNGTLEDHLHKLGTPLYWVQRLKICIGAGRGLNYLHTGTGIDVGVIHRDVKTSNILLEESWAAKISDFGLSKIGPTNQPVTYVNTRVKGTFGYFDPDYYATGNLTRKSDVFAFGVVLLEVLCRKRAVFDIDGEALNLAVWAQESIKVGNLKNIVDIDLRGQMSQKCLKKFVRIAERCLHANPKQRSTMAEVLVNLEELLSKQKQFSNSVQPAGRKIPDRMVNMLPFPSNGENTGIPSSSSIQLSQQCCRFKLSDIMLATRNFDKSLVIGSGGFGKVYRGTIVNGSATVLAAIKRLDHNSNQGAPEFWAEVEMLSKLRHGNLVSLFGYCNDEEEMILVYEYMPYGTLEAHLHKFDTPLSWVQLLKICIGASRGLDYLHTGTGIDVGVIHRDVKTSNILLEESWAAKISDFGLSKIGPTNQPVTYVNTLVKGTFGYFDPDYYATGNLTRKSDVFAFGVVLLEVLCCKRAVFDIDGEALNLAIWAQESIKEGNLKNIVDIDLRGQISSKCLKEFVQIAERCLHGNPKQRSTMAEVLVSLEAVLTLQEKFNNPVQPAGRTILDRMVNMLPFPSNGENTGSLLANQSATYLSRYEEEDHEVHLGQLKRFSLCELQVATRKFGNRHIIGRGGFGKVHKGLLADGTLVAVKRQREEKTQGVEIQFQTEVEMSGWVVHRNLLRLIGFCMTPTERLLVYPYMANGSVSSWFKERPDTQEPLDWAIRKRIALGSARGLAFMHDHCDPKIIHRDVKAANILLDEEFEAVVGDFGLAKVMDHGDTHVSTAVRGTIGHIAPEYLSTGKASEKTDVFGYGVMLLELITGQRAFDLARLANDYDVMLLDWVKSLLREKKLEALVDADLRGNYIDKEMEELIQVALLCTQGTPLERPKMSEVVGMLEGDGLAERWEEWQNEE